MAIREKCLNKRFLSSFLNSFFQHKRALSSEFNNDVLKRIRNIGILAHIDADLSVLQGKTTTTERMLFFSGKISCMGEVHQGNTVTDYMDQERNRGITITSASVSFLWKEHQINLIDTPGHIDFTMEVENALNVLDGCVIVLDSSAGVEAQTQTVWRQADLKNIPRIVYANKMDRQDASITLCEDSLQNKLGVEVFVTQLPIYGKDQDFKGVVDLLTLNKLVWTEDSKGRKELHESDLKECSDGALWEKALQGREKLIDKLSNFDDKLAEDIILQESLEKVSASGLSAALRRATILCKGVPLLCGSSYKNKGVQPLMDGVLRYLPSPMERSNKTLLQSFGNNLCAHAFKVVYHAHHGAVVFMRLYCGEISKKDKIFNVRSQTSEKCSHVLVATADDFQEVPCVTAGNIAVVSGLTETRAGDLITSNESVFEKACKKLAIAKNVAEKDTRTMLGAGIVPPDPVFFCSIEAPSQSQQVALDRALARLQREDSSLSVSFNDETSQTILGGMGELHLDIIKERLQTEYKLDILLGPIQIAYREALNSFVHDRIRIQEQIGSSQQLVELDLLIAPKSNKNSKEILSFFSEDPEKHAKMERLMANKKIFQALKNGVLEGLKYGPKLNCPLMAAEVTISDIVLGKGTSPTMIASATTQCIRRALQSADSVLMEPVMNVEVVLNVEHQSIVSADLARRRAEILNVGDRHIHRVLQARVPLSELLGYASNLRYLTSGSATFSMEFWDYQALPKDQEAVVIEKESGLHY